MKDFKGTKGKWISRYNGNYWEVNREEDFEDGKRLAISVMVFETKDGNLVFSRSGEAIANAKLIAAAPELLEALLNIENDNNSIPKTIWDLRNSAIKKATE